MNRFRALLIVALFSAIAGTDSVQAAPPTGWDSTIILRGAERAAVKSMPIEKRPNRPLHIYGNTIRRMEYRGRR